MKKEKKIVFIIGILLLLLFLGIVVYKISFKESKLDTKNYLTSVEIKSSVDFILLIDKNQKVSNVIFLNHPAVNALNERKINKQSIEKAVERIVDQLKNKWERQEEIKLINYGNTEIFNQIKEELNKEFVIYGINNQITYQTDTIESKVLEINKSKTNHFSSNLKILYDYSNKIKNTR